MAYYAMGTNLEVPPYSPTDSGFRYLIPSSRFGLAALCSLTWLHPDGRFGCQHHGNPLRVELFTPVHYCPEVPPPGLALYGFPYPAEWIFTYFVYYEPGS